MKIIYANSFFKRFKGLMGKKDFDDCMVFCNLKDSSIHTFFMRFTIDIYFIDENRIIYDKKTLAPWKFYKPEKQASFILETKHGKLDLKIGDYINLT
ncbi:MAG: hypothetical protein E7Z80_08430 [Methanobrevibacter thaueri]|nr:hypothetical protein [Methanobrevibacter thaueri]